jgi:hypothetical protein
MRRRKVPGQTARLLGVAAPVPASLHHALKFILNGQGTVPNFSGSWTLQSEIVSQSSQQAPQPSKLNGVSHVITITHTGNELRIEGRRGLFEGTPPVEIYRLDGSKGTFVQDFGDWWRKSQTQLSVKDTNILAMQIRVIAGYYNSGSPDAETLQNPHGDNSRIVTLSDDGNTLTVQTAVVGNGKPAQIATQVFHRTRQR